MNPLRYLVQIVPWLRRYFWAATDCEPTLRSLTERERQHGRGHGTEVWPSGDGGESFCVTRLSPGKVVGDARLVANVEGVAAGDIQCMHGADAPHHHWALKNARYRREVRLPGTSVLFAVGPGPNYYHWVAECLPRLHLLELADVPLDQIDHWLLNGHPRSYHHQMLDHLKIPAARRLTCSKTRVWRCDTLFATSMPGAPWNMPAWACEFVRERFLSMGQPSKSPKRVFVSRRFSQGRRLVEEDEIFARLQPLGFERFVLEQMSVAEQIGLFASACAVVGPHGAGLTNLVFAQPGTRVIEIFPPVFLNPCFENLSQTLGFRYARILGACAGEKVSDPSLVDVKVSAEAVLEAAERLEA